jgi:hypothetical protein
MSETWGIEDKKYFHKLGIKVEEPEIGSPKLDKVNPLTQVLVGIGLFAFCIGFWWFFIWAGTRLWKP